MNFRVFLQKNRINNYNNSNNQSSEFRPLFPKSLPLSLSLYSPLINYQKLTIWWEINKLQNDKKEEEMKN